MTKQEATLFLSAVEQLQNSRVEELAAITKWSLAKTRVIAGILTYGGYVGKLKLKNNPALFYRTGKEFVGYWLLDENKLKKLG